MNRLIAIFDSDKKGLHEKLAASPGFDSVIKELNDYFDSLVFKYKKLEELHPIEAKLGPFLIDIVRCAVMCSNAFNKTEIWKKGESPKVQKSASDKSDIILLVLMSFGAVGLLIAFIMFSDFLYAGGLAVIIGLALARIIRRKLQNRKTLKPDEMYNPLTAARIEIQAEADKLLMHLSGAFIKCDKFIGELVNAWSGKAGKSAPIDADVLELFQDLIYANDVKDSTFAFLKIKTISSILGKFGIGIERYEGNHKENFEFLESTTEESDQYVTVRPALVNKLNGNFIVRGIVEEPYRRDH